MPAAILHAGSAIDCAHGGRALPVALDARVRVSGQSVLVLGGAIPVSGCQLPPPNGPCSTARVVSGGSERVRIGGAAVLTDALVAVCEPTGAPLQVAAAQGRVRVA